MRNIWIIGFLFISIDLFSQSNQSNQSNRDLSYHIDSLELWNYDILTISKDEKITEHNPVCKIVFYRNTAIQDSLDKNAMQPGVNHNGRGLKPAIIFNVYPVSMMSKIKEMSNRVILTSSCMPPDRGGIYYVLKNFILLNYTSCTLCSTSSARLVDLCKGNIDRIISIVSDKEYKSFKQLCSDLPIKKGKYY